MSTLLTGSCPNCGSKLSYESNESTVTCFACDSTVRVSDIAGNRGFAAAASPSAFASFTGFDNPESGVVFLENFFETYDWDAYQQLPDITIPEIVEVIGNNKIKNGAVPETWYLDFMGLYVPVSKKFEGLANCEKEIIDKFNPIDPTDIFSAFDTYRMVATELLEEKESILKTLDAAIKYAERFSLSADRLAEMKKNLAGLQSKFSTIATRTVKTKKGDIKTLVIEKIEDLKAYDVAKENFANKANGEFTARGINAKEVYGRAVQAYNQNNTAEALSLFESIRAYSDSALYINKLNQYFDFFNEVYRFGGKHFIYKKEEYSEALNLKGCAPRKKAASAEEAAPTYALSLYEIVDGIPAEEPIIKGIDQVITCYGTKLFFFKTNKGIACYDLRTRAETIIDAGKEDLYKNESGEYECGFANNAPTFYIRKKFCEDIKGCFGKKKGTKGNDLNPYTLLLVDMSNNTCRIVVNEMVEIKLRRDDKVFYNFAYKVEKAKSFLGCLKKQQEEKPKSRLMVCDITKGTTAQVLDDDCDICDVKGDLIFYTLWKNNDLNEDLHVYNMETGVDLTIEKNIYEFFSIIDDKIYYTIGNAEFRPLVRANFDGSDREQVMLNVRKIEMIRGGWFYVTKGTGHNAVLVKIRADGRDARTLCTAIKKVVRFEGNYIYYCDVYGDLRVVRIDGAGNRLIAEKVDQIYPAEDGLYYCRQEPVEGRKEALSLYHMDKDGRNIRKIVFNVDKVQNDPVSNSIYYSKRENIRFKVYKPGKEDKAHYEFLNITKFYSFKKAEAGEPACEPVLYLTLGLPEHEKKKGCFARFKKDNIYVEAPIVHSYKNRGLSDAEIMAQEEDNIPIASSNTPAWMPAFLKNKGNVNSQGCAGGSKASKSNGCANQGCAPKKA